MHEIASFPIDDRRAVEVMRDEDGAYWVGMTQFRNPRDWEFTRKETYGRDAEALAVKAAKSWADGILADAAVRASFPAVADRMLQARDEGLVPCPTCGVGRGRVCRNADGQNVAAHPARLDPRNWDDEALQAAAFGPDDAKVVAEVGRRAEIRLNRLQAALDRKSTRLNS